MTNNEAIQELKERISLIDKDYKNDVPEYKKVFETAVAALEKQVPKKPKKVKNSGVRYTDGYICPSCCGGFTGTGIAAYCYHCGQAIEWGDIG